MRTQVIINNSQVDLLKEVNLNITKQLINIQNPDQRKADRTLTIDIPGSVSNNKLFSYIFEVNIDLDADDGQQYVKHFNPNKKVSAAIYIDSLLQLKGYCQLTDIVIIQENTIQYKIVCYGEVGDLFAKIDNQKDTNGNTISAELDDLDFSEFNHQYTRNNITKSWDTSIQVNGVTTNFQLGTGYVYPMIDYGYLPKNVTNPSGIVSSHWNVEQHRPAIYVKQYIDKIFKNVGYTYTSDFINSNFFKRLIVPFNSEKFLLDKDEVESRLFYAGRTNSLQTVQFFYNAFNIASAQAVVFNDDANAPYFDNGYAYFAGDGKFTCTKTGKYKFETSVSFALRYNRPGTSISLFSGKHVDVWLSIIVKRGGNYSQVAMSRVQAEFASSIINSGDVSSIVQLSVQVPYLHLNINEEVFVAPFSVEQIVNTSTSTGNLLQGWEFIVQNSAKTYFANGVADATINENDTISINSCVPTGIKQRDFLGSIIKAFNLYIEANPEKDNDVIIEPRASYYNGQYTDWTEKLDCSKEFTISPMAMLDAGEYYFKYATDEDYLNKTYRQQYGRTYGDYKLKIDNDFVKNSKAIELIFAPTPSYKEENSPTSRIIPYIGFADQNGKISPKTSKIRLLYYGGLKPCEQWGFEAQGVAPNYLLHYPYCGHLDDPYNSEFDLNFAPPFNVFYSSTANLPIRYTSSNLFTRYWYAQMEEISNKNSKLVEGWFYLTPADIEGLSFRKYFFIKDAYYRLLKVENYDPVFSKVTKCQFLKVLEFDAPLKIKAVVNGGKGTFSPATTVLYDIPTVRGTEPRGGNRYNPDTAVVIGGGNTIAGNAGTVLINGEQNTVLGGSERIAVIGGLDNTVYAGLENVTLINSSGVTVSESNTLFINNKKYQEGIMGEITEVTNLQSPFTLSPIYRTVFCNTENGNVDILLPFCADSKGKFFEIIKKNVSNTITITAKSGENINASNTLSLSAQYDKAMLVSNGEQWYKLN